MTPLLLILAAFLASEAAATVKSNKYTNIGQDGKLFTENIAFESPAFSPPHCALLCNQHESCETFTFHQEVCRGHGVFVTSDTSFTPADGARSFVKSSKSKPKDCVEAQRYINESGVVTIYPEDENTPLQVYCDQDTDGGGWLVFQRREDGSVDFFRNWTSYQDGFGNLTGEFWLGLDALHMLTSRQSYKLRVDMVTEDGTQGTATYSGFTINNSNDNYRLRLGNFTGGNANDSLSDHNGEQFSTMDADHDQIKRTNCASVQHGGWWYMNLVYCAACNLNGIYRSGYMVGVWWDPLFCSLSSSEMKMKPLKSAD
ncbi:microfibril-associated glycoprotein 4-like [Littorina saxatilis]|uniref:Fibrinogen C-terminal domain-containing protein n=1 Tax=Littorina saxatilis TaxID=31220 RepID=A0AAN9B2I4_9CAEN